MLAKANKEVSMYLTNSQEEYLQTIYLLEKSNSKVRVTDIATKLNITKPSVNKAINILKDLELINYKTYGNITLTELGENLSKEIIKKQDTLKMFLVGVLDIEDKEAEEEAKKMKHAMSKITIKKLEKYINNILNLGNLDCDYDENNKKCRECIKIKVRKRLQAKQ